MRGRQSSERGREEEERRVRGEEKKGGRVVTAMTTGMMDFMMASGRITAMAAIPVPDLAVPYAAPIAGGD